jgi:hypothetical protein
MFFWFTNRRKYCRYIYVGGFWNMHGGDYRWIYSSKRMGLPASFRFDNYG